MVTERGSPSGTATTMILTEIMKASTRWRRVSRLSKDPMKSPEAWAPYRIWQSIAINVIAAENMPTWPIFSAKSESFACRGVSSAYCTRVFLKIPYWLCSPTAKTIILPVPSRTLELEIMKGLHFSPAFQVGTPFLIPIGYPVIEDSSAIISWLSIRKPSTEMISPVYTIWTSPTKSSSTSMFSTLSPRTTLTFFFDAILLSFLNCCSLTQSFPEVTVTMITTATNIEAPYIHPCYHPSVATPKTRDTTDAKQRILSISSSKLATI